MKFFTPLSLLVGAVLLCPSADAAPRRGKPRQLLRPVQPYSLSYVPNLRWRTTLGMTKRTVPVIADLDLDGAMDIVFPAAGEQPSLVRLTDGGAVKWRIALPETVTAGVTLGDVNRDGMLDILVACGSTMLCYNARGQVIWKFKSGDEITSFPTIADLDADGQPEVLFGANDNILRVLNSKGQQKWKFTTKSWIANGVAVGNLQGGPELEIVFGSMDRNIHCLNATGRELWKYETQDWVQSSPALGDVDNDGHMDVVAASDDGELYCLSRYGTLKWQSTFSSSGTHQQTFVVLADLDREGTLETIVAEQSGTVKAYLSNGEEAWNVSTGGEVYGSPLVADLNGDTYQEVLVADLSGQMRAISTWGSTQWTISLGQGVSSTPTIADADRDGKWEIYVGNRMPSGISGFFSAYEISAKGGAATWPALKGDPYRTGVVLNAKDFGSQVRRGVDYATSWEPFGAAYRPKTGVQPPRRLRVTMLPLDDAKGNRDGALDPGETAWVRVRVENHGRGPSYDNTLKLDPGNTLISLDRNSAYLGWLAPGAAKTAVFRISAPTLAQIQAQLLRDGMPQGTFRDVAETPEEEPDTVAGRATRTRTRRQAAARNADLRKPRPAAVTMRVYENGVPAAVATAQLFKVPSLQPRFKIVSTQILDSRSKLTSGNGNGRLDAGESVVLRLVVRNDNLTTAESATATLASGTREVLPATPSVPMGTVVPYGVRTLNFGLRVAPQIWTGKAQLKLSTFTTTKSGPAPTQSQTFTLPVGAVRVDTTPPVIELANPPSAIHTTRAAQMTITGRVRDASPLAALLFERRSAKWLPGNRFAFSRKLNVGENVFPIAATDAAGNTTTRWIRVVRKP